MKIAYIAPALEIGTENGILKKIAAQLRVWKSCGVDARLFCSSPNLQRCSILENLSIDAVPHRSGFRRNFDLMPVLGRIRAWRPDILYYRFAPYYFGMSRLMGSSPTVIEINTDDLVQYRRRHSLHRFLYHYSTRHRLFSPARGFVAVTNQLGNLYRDFSRPVYVDGNGIDLSLFEAGPAPGNRNPHLVFIGGVPEPWHGVDEIAQLASSLPQWTFDIIGYEPSIVDVETSPNMILHGFRPRESYEQIMRNADVAIGTLSLHRIDMDEASPLKVREYLAYGLPVICAFRDPDFPHKVDYILRLPNEDDNLIRHRQQVIEFVEKWRGRRVDRDAVAHIDVHAKERHRLAFFDAVIRNALPGEFLLLSASDFPIADGTAAREC